MSPFWKSVLACALAEAAAIVLLTAYTHYLPAAVFCSVAFLGPISVWLGPILLKHYRRASYANTARP